MQSSFRIEKTKGGKVDLVDDLKLQRKHIDKAKRINKKAIRKLKDKITLGED